MLSSQLHRVQQVAAVCVLATISIMLYFVRVDATDVAVHFFDIGQGDASMIVLPGDVQILIDGGPDDSIVHSISKVMPFYDRHIEYMILTHPHRDHFEGLEAVARRYQVDTFIYNGIQVSDETLDGLFQELDRQKTHRVILESRQTVSITSRATLEFLFPDYRVHENTFKDVNDSSVVMRFVFGETALLFMGDASQAIEEYLIDAGVPLHANVLKIGHHGSKTATSKKFLHAVKPEFAVIQVGKNRYGHPHFRTLNALEQSGSSILRTDIDGAISFVTNGDFIALQNP